MSYAGDYTLEDNIIIPFTTRAFATGIPTVLVSGVVDIYEGIVATPILTAETLTVSIGSQAGFNAVSIDALASSGFEIGKTYTAVLDAGTVGGVSVVSEVIGWFTISQSAAAVDLANATDGLTVLKTEVDGIQADTEDLQTQIGTAGAGLTVLITDLDDIKGTSFVKDTHSLIDLKTETALIVADTGTDGVVLAADAITAAKIADNAIATEHIADGAITAGTLAADAITAAKVATDVHTEGANAVWDDAMVETTGAPAITGTFRAALEWMFALSRNKILQTATLTTLRNDADGADLATSVVADDATTYTRNEWST